MKYLLNSFKTVFSLDLRSLALMRVSVACILLYDLFDRARFLKDHYTDWGLLPRRLAVDKLIQERMSLYFASGEQYFTVMLFAISVICVLALMIGYRTRLATVLTWVLMYSLQNRGDWLNYSADVVVRLVLLWAIFLPWGAKFSVDSAFDDRPRSKPDAVFSVATLGFVIQFCLFYGVAGWLKTGDKWLDGSATYYALALDDLVRPLGVYVREYKEALVWLTKGVLAFEKIGWILLLIPFKFAFFRMLGMFGFLCLQMGFGNFLHVGIFPFISTAFLTSLLPSSFWIIASRKSMKKSQHAGTHIYYQANNRCTHRLFRIYQTFFLPMTIRVAPIQAIGGDEDALLKGAQYFVIDSTGKPCYEMEALKLLLSASPLLWPLAYFLKYKPVQISAGKATKVAAHLIQTPVIRKKIEQPPVSFKFYPGKAGNAMAAAMLIIVVLWNWSTLPEKRNHLPIPVQRVALRLGLDQKWSMFAPFPRTSDGWFVMPGQLRDGTEIDIRTGKNVTWDKPKNYASTIPSDRWRKYYENYAYGSNFNDFRMDYGKYLCREWNTSHPFNKQLMKYKIQMKREDELPGYKVSEPRDVHLWSHYCFDSVAPPDIKKK